jgi:aminoglycoside phosphotransferase (APT) family kinase protein
VSDAALGWAAAQLGRRVVDVEALLGGRTSTMLALTDVAGGRSVLRLVTEEPWRTHGAELTTRESAVQAQLAATALSAPLTIALDADGRHCGHPAHLMSLLPGRTDLDRVSGADLDRLADRLATIHAVRADPPPRTYQSWAWEAKRVVPRWSRHPGAWERAFVLLRQDPPPHEPTFLHRDFAPRNVLWDGDEISGVVDWVETSTGPAWLDVAHCRTNLVLDHGVDAADRFAAAYSTATGCVAEPWWDVLDVVGFLPAPGGEIAVADPRALARLDDHLARVVRQHDG